MKKVKCDVYSRVTGFYPPILHNFSLFLKLILCDVCRKPLVGSEALNTMEIESNKFGRCKYYFCYEHYESIRDKLFKIIQKEENKYKQNKNITIGEIEDDEWKQVCKKIDVVLGSDYCG